VTREVVFVRYFRAPLRRLELKQIANKKPCVAYDILFGCPGWIEGVLQANAYIKSGMAQRCLVIGSETLSRVVDDHKRLHDLFRRGWRSIIKLLMMIQVCFPMKALMPWMKLIIFGKSYNPNLDPDTLHKNARTQNLRICFNHCSCCYEELLEKSIAIDEVKKILIHQANEKWMKLSYSAFL
jgi:3-oxoacyl-[acyl-carrier-protein] synthase-3